jgi:hypothetical protein
MFPPSKLIEMYVQEMFALKKHAKGLITFLQHMEEHKLEASRIKDTQFALSIIWENGFNATHKVEVTFFDALDCVIGVATDTANPAFGKDWVVKELSELRDPPISKILVLNIDETLEYIRHFIWANHLI